MKKFPAIAFSGMLGILFAMSAHADVPSLLPVQGVLADASDVPVDDLVDMTFTIYPSEFGGIPVWTEVYDGTNQVDVEDGFFTVYLGEVQTLDMGILADEPELWLGITVGADSEMDRIRLATVPFAVEAHRCEQIGEITEADISGAPFYGISASQVSSWDAAYGWGNHAAAGYLTAETDPLFSSSAAATISAAQVADWDAAYGWGDHNGLYAPTGHKHDDLYYTETELQTSGAAQVNWDNLVNVPAGFADGTDDYMEADGVDYAQGDLSTLLGSTDTIIRSLSMTFPQSGHVVISSSACTHFTETGAQLVRCSITTGSSIDYSYLQTASDFNTTSTSDIAGTIAGDRGYAVSGGTYTFNLVCNTVGGNVRIRDANLIGIFSMNRH